MPIYEYVCPKCTSSFELLRPIKEADADAPCPQCRQPARRKPSLFACFSTTASGVPTRVAGTGSSCGSCGSGNCTSCGL